MTELTVLNAAAIEELLTIPMAVDAVEQAYLKSIREMPRCGPWSSTSSTPATDLDIKSGNLDGLGFYGLKVVSLVRRQPGKNRSRLCMALPLLFDLATGAPKALLNAGPITDFRTGAAGAIGAKYLARPDAKTLLMAGSGALAPISSPPRST